MLSEIPKITPFQKEIGGVPLEYNTVYKSSRNLLNECLVHSNVSSILLKTRAQHLVQPKIKSISCFEKAVIQESDGSI